MIEKNGAYGSVHLTPQLFPALVVRLRQADWAVCFPLIQGADVASRTITDAFIGRQVAYNTERAHTIVHVAIITSS